MQRTALFIDDRTKTYIYDDEFNELAHLQPIHADNAFWVPALGTRHFDGHIYVSGATGSGKSYIIRKMVNNDMKKRSCILFTDLKSSDPAFVGMNYVKFDMKDIQWLDKNKENKIMIFDDVQFSKDIIDFRDYMLEKGRHIGTIVICVNHRLQDYWNTKVPLNESRFIVTFPSTNRGAVGRYLKDELEIDKKIIQDLLDLAVKEGRHLIVHRFHPNIIATTESLLKL